MENRLLLSGTTSDVAINGEPSEDFAVSAFLDGDLSTQDGLLRDFTLQNILAPLETNSGVVFTAPSDFLGANRSRLTGQSFVAMANSYPGETRIDFIRDLEIVDRLLNANVANREISTGRSYGDVRFEFLSQLDSVKLNNTQPSDTQPTIANPNDTIVRNAHVALEPIHDIQADGEFVNKNAVEIAPVYEYAIFGSNFSDSPIEIGDILFSRSAVELRGDRLTEVAPGTEWYSTGVSTVYGGEGSLAGYKSAGTELLFHGVEFQNANRNPDQASADDNWVVNLNLNVSNNLQRNAIDAEHRFTFDAFEIPVQAEKSGPPNSTDDVTMVVREGSMLVRLSESTERVFRSLQRSETGAESTTIDIASLPLAAENVNLLLVGANRIRTGSSSFSASNEASMAAIQAPNLADSNIRLRSGNSFARSIAFDFASIDGQDIDLTERSQADIRTEHSSSVLLAQRASLYEDQQVHSSDATTDHPASNETPNEMKQVSFLRSFSIIDTENPLATKFFNAVSFSEIGVDAKILDNEAFDVHTQFVAQPALIGPMHDRVPDDERELDSSIGIPLNPVAIVVTSMLLHQKWRASSEKADDDDKHRSQKLLSWHRIRE